MQPGVQIPDFFDSLTGVLKFVGVAHIEPDFHKKHYHAIEMASAFLRVIANEHPLLEKAFRTAMPLPIKQGSVQIREAIPKLGLTADQVQWLDAQTTEILKVLVPVVRDPELPSWLVECKWAVEGAFYAP